MGAKVLLVGIDAAERTLIDAWTSDGRLPMLAELRARGRWGLVDPQPGLGDDAAWGSFSTTRDPAGHGRFYHARLAPDGVTLVPHRRDEMTVAPFWDALVEAGCRVAVVDVPKSPMGHDDALVIADWMTHGPEGPTVCSAAAAAHPVAERLGDGGHAPCDDLGPEAETVAEFGAELVRRTEHRTAILGELLAGDDWDLFTAVFGATHCVGHQQWRDHDPRHPEFDARRRARTGDVMEQVYVAVDRGLRTLVDAAGPGAVVIAFSLLGMGPNHQGTHLVEDVLREVAGARAARSSRWVDRVRRAVPASLRRRAPAPVAAVGRSTRERHERSKPYRVLPVDLATTALRITAADEHTDPTGVRHVPPEARRTLVDALGAMVDPDSRRPLVEEVVFTQDAYPGARTFVDALVVWSSSAPISGARIDGIGVIRRAPPPLRSGNHRPGGWFIVAGADVVPSPDPARCAIVDFGPSVAARLGVTLRATDGRVDGVLAPRAPGAPSPG